MASTKKVDLYNSVILITADYLGPAASRFIDRQIENHLNKPPKQLNKKDLEVLIEWARVAIALLTEDKSVVEEYSKRLTNLKKNGRP